VLDYRHNHHLLQMVTTKFTENINRNLYHCLSLNRNNKGITMLLLLPTVSPHPLIRLTVMRDMQHLQQVAVVLRIEIGEYRLLRL
jgi:hypothetical protein